MTWTDPATQGIPAEGSVIGHVQADEEITDIELDHAALSLVPVLTKTVTSYTPLLGDSGAVINFTSSSPIAFNVPLHSTVAFPVGAYFDILQGGAGLITIEWPTGVSVGSPGDYTSGSEGTMTRLIQTATNVWNWQANPTAGTVPGAPGTVTAVAGNGSVVLTWTAPTTNGGSAISGYVITPFINSTAGTPITVGNVLTETVTGLTNGTPIAFTVAAINTTGTGRTSTTTTVTPASSPTSVPSNVIDLRNFYLGLPVSAASQGLSGSNEADITNASSTPLDGGYSLPPYFYAPDNTHVIFSAPVNGVTTSGSSYPRTELREMYNNGTVNASWDATIGTHTMTVIGSTDVLPGVINGGTGSAGTGKPQTVACQIHNASGNTLEILVDGEKGSNGEIYIGYRWPNSEASTYLDTAYVMGTTYTITIVVSGGEVTIFYDEGSLPGGATTQIGSPLSYSSILSEIGSTTAGNYFKCGGAYVQCNASDYNTLPNPVPVGTARLQEVDITHVPYYSVDSTVTQSSSQTAVQNSGAGSGYTVHP